MTEQLKNVQLKSIPNHEKKAFRDMTPEERSAIVEELVRGDAECFYDNKRTPSYGIIELHLPYRTRPRKLVIPWEHIKPEYKWAAMNRNGNLHVYTDKPYNFSNQWISHKGHVSAGLSAINIDTTGIDWRESLTERPKGEDV